MGRAAIADVLNRELLPKDYVAEMHVHVGSRVEVDVVTFEDREAAARRRAASSATRGQAVAVLEETTWAPPAPSLEMPALFPDSIEVLVVNPEAGPMLVGAIELVSPGNKDRPETRRAFAAKCASYLQVGVGPVVIDIVTGRAANLHNDLIDLLGTGPQFSLDLGTLYVTAYRPSRRAAAGPVGFDDRIAVWAAPLAVGQPLPTMPLPLDKQLILPLDLEATYAETCRQSRLP